MAITKEQLIDNINTNYQQIERILQVVPAGCANNLRPILEACVKLFWLIKYDKDPVWINSRGKEEFILHEAIKDERFSKYFSPLLISDMHTIRSLGNNNTHNTATNLTASEVNELFDRLKKIITEIEKILGFPIIQLVQTKVDLSPTTPQSMETIKHDTPIHPLLHKNVKHWVYGEGKIIKIVGDRMIVQFSKKQEEFGQDSFKNGFLKLTDSQKSKIESTTPRTYAPNTPEIKQVIKPTVITDYNETAIKSIGKFDAIRLFKNNGLNILSRNCTFASKNSMSYLYWANPKTDLLEDEWWLILNDNINYKLHIFKIPANSLDINMIKVRADKPYLIDLQILFDDDDFTDTRSNIQFAKWYIKTLSY